MNFVQFNITIKVVKDLPLFYLDIFFYILKSCISGPVFKLWEQSEIVLQHANNKVAHNFTRC